MQADPTETARDEWISAADAYGLVRALDGRAAETIATRAYNGLVRSRAQLLVYGNKRGHDVEIPSEFWWAKGHGALSQNWNSGDFNTVIGDNRYSDKVQCYAFGVTFHRADIERILPQRPKSADVLAAAAKGGRKRSDLWVEWTAELVRYIYFEGIPEGAGRQGADQLIEAIEQALSDRGLEGPSRSTVQPTIWATLDRLRGAEK